jgi:hypothetical protein
MKFPSKKNLKEISLSIKKFSNEIFYQKKLPQAFFYIKKKFTTKIL